MRRTLIILIGVILSSICQAQITFGEEVDFSVPKQYEIGGITVMGAETTDVQAIKLFAGLSVGDRVQVPGERISSAIRNLWKQDLFADVAIYAADIRGETIYLVINVVERSRLSKYKFHGVTKAEADDLRDKINLVRGKIVNENILTNTKNSIRNEFMSKGYLKTTVRIEQSKDENRVNSEVLDIYVKKGNKFKVNDISFNGNVDYDDSNLKGSMKNVKEKRWYSLLKKSKYSRSGLKEDKSNILAMYNADGYRNAKVLSDSIWDHNEKTINISIDVFEGSQFYFRNISWLGNTKYTDDQLTRRLGILKGEIYNQDKLNQRLFQSPNGGDVSSLYLDNGYLSFNAVPVEVRVDNDSIDLEVRIYEGKQYRINKVSITGNTITNDHVVMREIRTRP